MSPVFKIIVLMALPFVFSCNSSKKVPEEPSITTETKEMNKELISEGYAIGMVKHIKNSECDYIIVDEKTSVEFDPINFKEDAFKSMKIDNQKVYYKYHPLRMMNRCGSYQPVKILEIKKY